MRLCLFYRHLHVFFTRFSRVLYTNKGISAMQCINNGGEKAQGFVWLVVGILWGQCAFGQHLFDVAQKELSAAQTASVRAHIRQAQGTMLRAEAGARKMSVPVALRKTSALVLINAQSGRCATLSGFSARFPEAELTPLLLAELKQSALGDAQEYTCVTVDDLSAETPAIGSAKRISAVTDSVKLPVFKYGKRGNIKTAHIGDRKLVTVFRKKPRFIPVNPNDPVARKKIEALEESRAYYAYTYQLPDGSLCTYDEAAGANLLAGSAQSVRVGSSLSLDLSFSGMTAQQQTASQYGAGLWGAQLVGKVPVAVSITFTNLAEGVLGCSYSPTAYLSNGVYYPAALCNQIAGEDLDPNSMDIRLEFNTQYAFYFGTDMDAGLSTDYVTILLHELTHGLGFFDSIDSTTGAYGYDTYPLIYDTFLYHNGSRLTALSDSGRAAAICSDALYFDGTNAAAANSGSRIKLYAPTTYQSGSSVSHWDTEVSFATFMKYAYQSPLHTIGARKLGLMKDLGWSLASEIATPPAAPAGVAASDATYADKVRITWSVSAGATSYPIYRSTSSNSVSAAQIGTATSSPYDDAAAVAGTTYYYWVKAANNAGTSAFSASDTGYCALAAPANVSASSTGWEAVTVTWIAVTGASHYCVYRATTYDGEKTALGSWQSALSYSDTSAIAGMIYYYWVAAAVDSSGTHPSVYSDSVMGFRKVAMDLGAVLDNTSLTWTTGGDATWFGQTDTAYDGFDAAQSGTLSENQSSWLQTTVTGPGTMSFWWQVASESSINGLQFSLDGTNLWSIAGTSNWAQCTFSITDYRTHTLKWTYAKAPAVPTGSGCGWVDQVVWASSGGGSTTTTEVSVPYAWLEDFGLVTGGNYEAAAMTDTDGDGMTAWQEYVADSVPTNAASVFLASVTVSNGMPRVAWIPDLGAERVYTIEGKASLTNTTWASPTNAASRFFRVKVAPR